MNPRNALRRSAWVLGAACLLVGSGAAAVWADDEHGSEEITVTVDIDEVAEPGFLALSVSGNLVVLSEEDSDDDRREFVGQLPTVTVTDTRSADEVPEGAAWYVLGTATDFAGDSGQDPIGAGHLGWAPEVIGDNDGDGLVAPGDEVDTVMDAPPNNVGLVDQELLFSTWDSGAINPEGQWSATADLFLRVPTDVSPGSYNALLTLSLFE